MSLFKATIQNFDIHGIGSVMLLSPMSSLSEVLPGQVVDAADFGLRAASINSDGGSTGFADIARSGPVVPGQWKCLGYMQPALAGHGRATLFVRIS